MSLLDGILSLYEKHTPKITFADTFIKSAGTPLVHLIPAAIVVIYVLGLRYLPPWQRKHQICLVKGKPVDGKPRYYLTPVAKFFFFIWNIFLSVYSIATFTFLLCSLLRNIRDEPEFGWFEMFCPKDERYYGPPYAFWVYLFVISKLFELCDTFLLLLKNPWRTPLFLHRWHHASIVPTTWCLIVFDSSIIFFGAFMNTFVHSVMYAYYAIALYIKPPFPMLITFIQISQMIVGTISQFVVTLWIGEDYPCGVRAPYWYYCALYISYLVLFIQFFMKRYCGGRRDRRQKNKKDDGDADAGKSDDENLSDDGSQTPMVPRQKVEGVD